MEKTTWSALSPDMRAELEALIASPTHAWLSDFDEVASLLIIAFLVGLGGSAALFWYVVADFGQLGPVAATAGLILALTVFAAGIRAAVVFGQNKGRRGYAALTDAIVVVRGNKLGVLPYARISETTTRVVGNEQKSFTLLTATLDDGSVEKLHVHGRWVKLVQDRVGW